MIEEEWNYLVHSTDRPDLMFKMQKSVFEKWWGEEYPPDTVTKNLKTLAETGKLSSEDWCVEIL